METREAESSSSLRTNEPFHMKVIRKWKQNRRRSITPTSSRGPQPLDDSLSRFPSETSSNASWDIESQFANPASNPALVTPRSLSLDDPAPDDGTAESLTRHPASSVHHDDSNVTNCTTTEFNRPLSMVIYERPASPQPLPESIKIWSKSKSSACSSGSTQLNE